MHQLTVSITPVLAPPPKGSELVVFADPRSYVAEIDSHQMLAAAARYAIKHKVYLVPERFVAANSLCLCMLSPDGSVLGVSRACHLNVILRQNNFSRYNAVEPFDTPFGRVALVVDVDINMPQIIRSAVLQGTSLIISSQHIPLYDFNQNRLDYGIVNAAATNGVQIISSIGLGGAVVDARGRFVKKYTDNLPLTAQIETEPGYIDIDSMIAANNLLLSHRDLILDETEGAKNE